jgi:hypothetical protein
MSAAVTCTFTRDADVQQAVDALTRLGVPPNDIRVIAPGTDDAEPAGDADIDEGGAGAVGLAAAGLAMGGGLGTLAGTGYPIGELRGGFAAGAVLAGALGALDDLELATDAQKLYRSRLREGATVVAIHTVAVSAEQISAALEAAGAADVHSG